jgi:hypothetical protein
MEKRWRSLLPLIVFILLGLPAVVSAEMWRCALPDGSEIYTNTPKEYQQCLAFEPVSDLSVFSRVPAIGVGPRLLEVEPVQQPERAKQVDVSPVLRDMPFEVFRMLSLGMNEAEILHRAGPPSYVVPNTTGAFGLLAPISSAARYYYLGDWTVTVTFDLAGRVINLDRSRPSP